MTFLSIASRRVRYSLIETGSLCDLSLRKKSISMRRPFYSRHDLPAVRVQELAAVVARFVACQEHVRRGDVLRRAEAAERQACGMRALRLFGERVEAGVDEARRDAVHQDSVGRELLGERAHE